jgi:hypothetical protein
VAIADLNGDGKPEVAFTNWLEPGSVSVFLNKSDPGQLNLEYLKNPFFITNGRPEGIVLADLDGDGRPDISTANGTLSVQRNQAGEEPSIYSFTPAAGVHGDTITITGKNFTGTSALNFGGMPAASYAVVSPTVIKAVVSADGASGDISLVTPKGQVSKGVFIYAAAPTINSIGPINSTIGNSVTLVGDNFIGVTAVSFGGVPATSFEVESTNRITAVVGYGATGDVSATNPYGTGEFPGFTYIPQPIISSFSPSGGVTGTVITIVGKNFNGASTVKFGGVDASSFTVVSPDTITAIVGSGASGYITVVNSGWTGILAGFVFNPGPAISFTGDTAICQGESLTLRSSASITQWYKDGIAIGGATLNTLVVEVAGTYTATTLFNGQVSAMSSPAIVIIIPAPAKPTIHWDANLGMVSSADTGNQWYSDTQTPIPGATGKSYKPASAQGFFYLKVTQTGCSSPMSDRYEYVVTATINLGGPDKYIRVAPNPVAGLLYIQFSYPGITTLMTELTDIQGHRVLFKPVVHSGDQLDLSGYSKGLYFLKVFSANGRINVTTPVLKL